MSFSLLTRVLCPYVLSSSLFLSLSVWSLLERSYYRGRVGVGEWRIEDTGFFFFFLSHQLRTKVATGPHYFIPCVQIVPCLVTNPHEVKICPQIVLKLLVNGNDGAFPARGMSEMYRSTVLPVAMLPHLRGKKGAFCVLCHPDNYVTREGICCPHSGNFFTTSQQDCQCWHWPPMGCHKTALRREQHFLSGTMGLAGHRDTGLCGVEYN